MIPLWKGNFPFRRWLVTKNRVEELRKIRGIKQDDLAKAMDVSRQTIGSIENGRYNPSISLAFKLSRFFELPIEEIFIYEEDTNYRKGVKII